MKGVGTLFDIWKIKDPSFLANLSYKEKEILATEIREFLINNIAKTGGHLASNLGIVELSIALYSVFDYEKTDIIYDVGHQSYVHKILTGRAKDFTTLRQYGGLSGYMNRAESPYDIFESGHSSTPISAMSGLMIARGKNTDRKLVTVIGDASIVNGISFEALNYLGTLKDYNPLIILNDNKMGISKSVGALSVVFDKLRNKKIIIKLKKILNNILPTPFTNMFHRLKRSFKAYIQHVNIFEDLGFNYYGPVNGNDLKSITQALKRVKDVEGPVLLHVITEKGRGYNLAEQDDIGTFHGVEPFDTKTGKSLKRSLADVHSFSEVVSEVLIKLRKQKEFYIITPAMKVGAKLERFSKLYPDNLIDVGIAEEHATVMASGIVLGGKRAVLLMYSTFAQRAYDFLLMDIARQDIPVIIGIDRAGVVGHDGPTHQGIYDVAMFNSMPNIIVVEPRNAKEAAGLFTEAFNINHPVVIRYPRKDVIVNLNELELTPQPFKWEIIRKGSKAIIIAYGAILEYLDELIVKNNLDVYLVNARVLKPLDYQMLDFLKELNLPFLVIEEVITTGSIYSNMLAYNITNVSAINFSVDDIIEQGSIVEVLAKYGFNNENILKKIKEICD